jgi:hypothetical protein
LVLVGTSPICPSGLTFSSLIHSERHLGRATILHHDSEKMALDLLCSISSPHTHIFYIKRKGCFYTVFEKDNIQKPTSSKMVSKDFQLSNKDGRFTISSGNHQCFNELSSLKPVS